MMNLARVRLLLGAGCLGLGILVGACDRGDAPLPPVARPENATGPSSQAQAEDEAAQVLATLERIPELGPGVAKKMPDGELWQVYKNGLAIQMIRPGNGNIPRPGQTLTV